MTRGPAVTATKYASGTVFSEGAAGVSGGTQGRRGSGFMDSAGPSVRTEASEPTEIGTSSATVHSLVNANDDPTTGLTLQYSKTADFHQIAGTATPSPPSADGTSDTNLTSRLTGLAACTTYYYRITASNPDGTTIGDVASFTTECSNGKQALPLTVTSRPVSSPISSKGRTILVKRATTSAQGRLKAQVRCMPLGRSTRGDLGYCTYTFNPRTGRLVVRTLTGLPMKVRVRIVSVPKQNARDTMRHSKVFSRSWKTR